MNRFSSAVIIAIAIGTLNVQAQERITRYIPSAKPDRIVLNITEDPATSIAVTWRTDTTVRESLAQITVNLPTIFLADSALTVTGSWQDVPGDGVTGRFHSVIFTGLKPGTGYAYRVGSGANASEWFTFMTAEAGTAPLTFLYFGDSQIGSKSLYARVIRQAYNTTPDARLMLFTGDLVDGGSGSTLHDDEWGDWHAAAGFIASVIPVMPTPGNHEHYDPVVRGKRDLNRYWRAGFTLPVQGPAGVEETAYSVDCQGVRFIVVNSDEMVRNEALARAQTEWVEGLLRNNPCKWTVAAFHHPVYSTSARRDNKVVRESLKPLFDRYGVDLVLTGHDHTYARGMIVPDSSDMKGNTAGTVYVVSVSGSKQYQQDAKPWWQVGLTNTQLWQKVTIDGDRLYYKAYDASGRLADQFTLTRLKNGRKTLDVQSTGKKK
jgi:3',5'-cyclic AMP phosphodiesterase CpdA